MSKTTTSVSHPAKYTPVLLPVIAKYLEGCTRVIDPMAGVGIGLEVLRYCPNLDITCVELESEFAAADPRIQQGDARHLPYPDGYFDGAFTSPPYGNRMADKLSTGKWAYTRHTYAVSLGRELTEGSAASFQWGDRYRDVMKEIWAELSRVLCLGAVLVINSKNHIRGGRVQYVSEWHSSVIRSLGFDAIAWEKIAARGLRRGENYGARVTHEDIMVFRKQ